MIKNRILHGLAQLKVFQSRIWAYVALFNALMVASLWLQSPKGDTFLFGMGIILVICIGLLDWKFIFKREQGIYFNKNPVWTEKIENIERKLDKLVEELKSSRER